MSYPNYPTDHIITKTTYLDDPEGNNIELYTESPEDGTTVYTSGVPDIRYSDGTPSDGREPLDIEALLSTLLPQDRLDHPMPLDTRIGHFHLYVANLEKSMHFYHDILGFDNMGLVRPFRMVMVSAGVITTTLVSILGSGKAPHPRLPAPSGCAISHSSRPIGMSSNECSNGSGKRSSRSNRARTVRSFLIPPRIAWCSPHPKWD